MVNTLDPAARGETVAFHLLLEPPGGTVKEIKLNTSLTLADGKPVAFEIFRDWYVKQGAWYPEACVPLKGSFDIPWEENRVIGQKNQSVLIECYIPKTATSGKLTGYVHVTANGIDRRIPLVVTILPITLPDKMGFEISLNGYGTVGTPFGIDDRTADYRSLEKAYHRMAHEHRSTLALLGYSHSGTVSTDYAPPLEGVGSSMRVVDWKSWDIHFGSYFDGTAFKGLKRESTPISHFYLPFHEDWPSKMVDNYRYKAATTAFPEMIVEHALRAAPITETFDPAGVVAFRRVAGEFLTHFAAMGWNQTSFQLYQNDKNYYKDPKTGGRGTSWWLLDEPNFRDDWLALAFFAKPFAEATANSSVKFIHREDISRPQWQRDYLNGLVQLMVVSNELYNKQPMLKELQLRQNVIYWNYGSANDVNRSNMEAEAWAIRAWIAGADGIVPWNSIGEDKNFEYPEATALFLPGKRFGINGPVASLRLKSLRRAQQDVEYVIAYSRAHHLDREQLAQLISKIVPMTVEFRKQNDLDAGQYHFGNLGPETFSNLRRALSGGPQ